MADKINYTDTSGKSYTELKTIATSSLSLTSSTFTWSQSVNVGTKWRAAQINEIVSAMNTSYDNINTGCNSNYTSMLQSQYGYSSCSHICTANYAADHSSNYTSHQANYTSCSTNYLTVYYSELSG